jgi:hypothetical protein
VIRVFPKLTGTNSPELGPTDVAEADSVQGSERRRYNVTTPVIGVYVDFILFASVICASRRLGSDSGMQGNCKDKGNDIEGR